MWENRLPDGMSYRGRAGHELDFTMTFPVDDDGLSPLRCPQDPNHEFKALIVSGSPDDTESDADVPERQPARLHCPYCGHSSDDAYDFMPEHLQLAREAMKAAAEQFVHDEVNKMLGNAFGGQPSRPSSGFGISMSYKSGSPPPIRALPPLRIEATRRAVTCSACSATFAVYGIARYCPSCGQLGSADAFGEAIDKHRRSLATLEDADADTLRRYREAGLLQSTWENTLKDGIGALETFLKETFASLAPAEAQPRDTRIFQRFEGAADLLREHLAIDLPQELAAERWNQLLTFAAMRHVLTHNQGAIDEKFLARVGSWHQPIGARLIVTASNATDLLDVLTAVLVVVGASQR